MSKVLLITPPLVQINTPYPATAYLKGFLNAKGVESFQMDLGLELILSLFSSRGLEELKQYIHQRYAADEEVYHSAVWNNFEEYISTVDPVISFLQNKNSTLAFSINTRQFLPEGPRFEALSSTSDLFGQNDVQDKARHIATLYIEDLSDFISEFVDENFGLSRYAESIAHSAKSFDKLYQHVLYQESYIMTVCYKILVAVIKAFEPGIIAFTIPFPGNLTAALYMSMYIKRDFPEIKIVYGGGYCNTELRQINDSRFFEFADFMTLDDGERPVENIIQYISVWQDKGILKRTFLLSDDGAIEYHDNADIPDYHFRDLPAPSYAGLKTDEYLSVLDLVNPMHRLWSDGRWNKMTLAHGCYWAKCTFCDVSLSYIADYHSAEATQIADHIEQLIAETSQRGFHFVDEAAPPALIKELSLELIRRKIKITWWTNIRFEKSFTKELCQLMVRSGCIAVSGGLEVASNRLLELIRKGVTVEQVARVCHDFKNSGILVHAYLMYGFPTQSEQETIDSLEMVRQMFAQNILESAYWHKFTMTVHSPCGQQPESFSVRAAEGRMAHSFANNDIEHIDDIGAEHDKYTDGLNTALYNFMHKNCLDWPVQEWFDFRTVKTSVAPDHIKKAIDSSGLSELRPHKELIWTGTYPDSHHMYIDDGVMYWTVYNHHTHLELELEEVYGVYLFDMFRRSHVSHPAYLKVSEWKQVFRERIPDDDFDDFMLQDIYPGLNPLGLIYI